MTTKRKHQRLVLVLLAVGALIGAVMLAMWGLADRAAYFRTPQDVAAGRAEVGVPLRLGGIVKEGSIRKLEDGVTVAFVLTDGPASVPVRFTGIVPDLFVENSGAVAEGQLKPNGLFVADNILAKHDERYMPPQMGDLASEMKTRETLQ
jgi:cytochrome c-type biogenesis protein CcmE